MTEIPKFTVGQVFAADDPKAVAIVRLAVAAQGLVSLGRLLGPVLPETKPYRETKHYFMLLSLGLANEAAGAFQAAVRKGAFEGVSPSPAEDINSRYERLLVESDRDRPESLRSRLVAFGRNKLSFHWDEKEIRKGLRHLASETLPAWAGGEDETPVTTALPIAEVVTITALGLHVGEKKELNDIMSKIAVFQGDLLHVSYAVYASALARHRNEPNSA